RHQLKFELLADGPITATVLAEAPGRLALKLPFADIADVGADHEAEQMLGVDALGMDAGRQQRSKRHDRRLEGLCTARLSLSAGQGFYRKVRRPRPRTHPSMMPGPSASHGNMWNTGGREE